MIGRVRIGAGNPITIQSMTNTPTNNIQATVSQFKKLADAGAELVRVAVDTPSAAKSIPIIREQLNQDGYSHIPLIGDFHYNGHILLDRFPGCAKALDKYRINPGNTGRGSRRADHFLQIVKIAIKNDKPIRIGVNYGSLDQDILMTLMNDKKNNKNHTSDRDTIIEAVVLSALNSAKAAESVGMLSNQIVLSVKMSDVQDMIRAYELLHKKCQEIGQMYPLHLGLTEAGSGMRGIISSSAALAVLLRKGIGDTIRISLTPTPGSNRTDEVEACKLLLQTMNIRQFHPLVTSCPGCGRTNNTLYQRLAYKITRYIDKRFLHWQKKHPGVVSMKVAVMGCVVNGPGESIHADIGISLPGASETATAVVYKNGEFFCNLKDMNIIDSFKKILDDFVSEKYT